MKRLPALLALANAYIRWIAREARAAAQRAERAESFPVSTIDYLAAPIAVQSMPVWRP